MGNLLLPNLGLVTVRQVAEGVFNHAFVSDKIIESRVTLSNKGIAFVFPLYIYPTRLKEPNSESDILPKRVANVNPSVLKDFELKIGRIVSPEQLVDYVYAVLNSPRYRGKFAEFLKLDFPRIPLPSDRVHFDKLVQLGHELIGLHLEHQPVDGKIQFDVQGSNLVEAVKRVGDKVFLNATQYFDGISDDLWGFEIGGYRTLEKWLKSRRGLTLDSRDIEHYARIAGIVRRSLKLMKEIDSALEL